MVGQRIAAAVVALYAFSACNKHEQAKLASRPPPHKPEPPKPVDVTFADLVAGKAKPNSVIAVDAVIVPEAIIRTEEAQHHYYVLAVPKDAKYFQDVGKLADEADKLAPDVDKLARLVGNETKFIATSDKVTALSKRTQELEVDITGAIAIELADFSSIGSQGAFETVIHEGGIYDVNMANMANIANMGRMCAGIPCAEDDLAAMEKKDPPDLDAPMPDLSMVQMSISGWNPDPNEVDRYNRIVGRYNREITRRRKYVAMMMPGELAKVRASLHELATRPTEHLVGKVAALPDLAQRTLDKIHGGHPPRFVIETSGADAIAKHFYANERFLVSSYPSGADVTINGAAVGKTPVVAGPFPVGKGVDLSMTLKGYDPVQDNVPVTPSLTRITDLKRTLVKTKK